MRSPVPPSNPWANARLDRTIEVNSETFLEFSPFDFFFLDFDRVVNLVFDWLDIENIDRTLIGNDIDFPIAIGSLWSNCVAFSTDGLTLASSKDKNINLWHVNTGDKIRTLTGHSHIVSCIAFSPDGLTFASCSGKNIKLWDATNWQEICTLTNHSDAVWSIAFSPDGKTLASGSQDKTIKLWRCDVS